MVCRYVNKIHELDERYSSIKMDEKAAESMGINITYYKVLSFTQGAFLAGFAGALFAHVIGLYYLQLIFRIIVRLKS